MGELARFEDIRIKMYPMDTQKHKEPHFHIILTDGTIEWQCCAELSNDTFYIAGEESKISS